MQNEWKFQTSRRGLLRFLSGATLVGGAAVAAKTLPDPAEGMVKLATEEEMPGPFHRVRDTFIPSGSWPIDTRCFNLLAWRLYDTITLDQMMGTVYYFFQHYRSMGTGPQVTNMMMPNSLPQPQYFQVHRMWMLLSGSRMDAESFAPPASLQLIIGNKIYSEVPVLDICRYGLESVSIKDEPGPRYMDFRPMLMIEPGCYFAAKLEGGGTWSAQLHAKLILDGLMAFGVQ